MDFQFSLSRNSLKKAFIFMHCMKIPKMKIFFDKVHDSISPTMTTKVIHRKVQVIKSEKVKYCVYCKTEGHHISECQKVHCRQCGVQGHIDENCTVEECTHCGRYHSGECWFCERCEHYGHKTENCLAPECEKCNRIGHTADKCWFCNNCQTYGHKTEKCRTVKCEHCERIGHMKKDCNKLQKCTQCGMTGHKTEHCETESWCYVCAHNQKWDDRHVYHPETHFTSGCKDLAKHACAACGEKGHPAKFCENPYIRR